MKRNKNRSARKAKRESPRIVDRGVRTRLFVLMGIFILWTAAILMRAYWLQTVSHTNLENLARRQHERVKVVRAHRGTIFDRNGFPLALSLPMPSAFVNPRNVKKEMKIVREIAGILDLSESQVAEAMTADRTFSWLKRQITPKQLDQIREILPQGVYAEQENRRFYPNQNLAAHVLGFVGLDGVGLAGIEMKFEEMLAGEEQVIHLARDAKGRALDLSGHSLAMQSHHGRDLTLTLDRNIQYIAERELQKAALDAHAKSGHVIVMEPHTGEILALANWPNFDPNQFRKTSDEERRNRAITDVFEPGSSLKMFVIAKALEKKLIGESERIFCENGSFRVHEQVINDVKPKGYLTVAEILKYSSNIGMYKIAERFPPSLLFEGLLNFGFGEKTGMAVLGESRGILRPPKEWYGVTKGTIGFGQGIAVTGLQLARAVSAIANGGLLVTPQIVKTEMPTEVIRQSISPELAEKLTHMMEMVCEEGGTGALAAIPGYRVAGKTGTSQKPSADGKGYAPDRYVATFVGFVPAQTPRLVISVVLDEPERESFGGIVAAPVFRRIAEQSLVVLGIKPDMNRVAKEATEKPKKVVMDARTPVSPTWASWKPEHSMPVMANVVGLPLRDALKRLDSLPIKVRIKGQGVVVRQEPPEGTALPLQEECLLFAAPVGETENPPRPVKERL